ncbi:MULTISPECIES: hypothetical protein [Lysinibacillus]|uniref:hypothetical protein n=1 Tax=Lysinibacillus TaxID=400634 RepID=UPI000C1A114F|nr:hypothetical protein [Lysinibacillus sphaericus]PIJ95813.1 hypothetical protein CTN02_21875 [Lysinibacillus sphaericus]
MTEAIQISILFLIGILSYVVFDGLNNLIGRRKYKLKSLSASKEDRELVGKSIIRKFSSLKNIIDYIATLLKDAQYTNITAEKFIVKKIIIAISSLIPLLIVYQLTQQRMLLLIGIPLVIVMIVKPLANLKEAAENARRELNSELLDYLYHFFVLLKNYTPNTATQNSVQYAGPYLIPHVEQLNTQVTLNPSSSKPYYDFAESVGIQEAKEFAFTLEQFVKLDATEATEVLEDQLLNLEALQEENYKDLLIERPEATRKVTNFMLIPFFVVMGTMLFVIYRSTYNF